MTNKQYLLWWKMTSALHIGQYRLFFVQWACSILLKKLKFSYKFFSHNFTIVTEYQLAPSHLKTRTWAWNRVVSSHARWAPRAGMCLSKWKRRCAVFVVLVDHRKGVLVHTVPEAHRGPCARAHTRGEDKGGAWKVVPAEPVLALRRCFPLRPGRSLEEL